MDIAGENFMVNATEYRAIAAEHHRFAGMCRSPESREQHLRAEKELLALADGADCLHDTRSAQHETVLHIANSADRVNSAPGKLNHL
jgi:hypothetical protein